MKKLYAVAEVKPLSSIELGVSIDTMSILRDKFDTVEEAEALIERLLAIDIAYPSEYCIIPIYTL